MALDDVKVEHIVAFGDALFAFSITFMAISLTMPEIQNNANEREIIEALASLWPKILQYIISFVVVSFYWVGFHRTFNYIKHTNSVIIWLTLLFLLFITFVSFATGLVVEDANSSIVMVIYSLILSSTGFISFGIWYYSSRNQEIVDNNIQPSIVRHYHIRSLVPSLVFLATIPVAFIDPRHTPYTWLVMFPITSIMRRKYA